MDSLSAVCSHDNLKVGLQVFSYYKVPLKFYIYENYQENMA